MTKQNAVKIATDLETEVPFETETNAPPTQAELDASAGRIDAQPLTAERIRELVTTGIDTFAAAFYQPEQRLLADNGKRYPLDVSLPAGVQSDGEIVVVNTYEFVQQQLVNCVTWKLESMLDDQDKRVASQVAKIRAAKRDLDRGVGSLTSLRRMMEYLSGMREQHAVVLNAFKAAREAHYDVLGHEFETKAMKLERERFSEAAASRAPRSELDAELAALGC